MKNYEIGTRFIISFIASQRLFAHLELFKVNQDKIIQQLEIVIEISRYVSILLQYVAKRYFRNTVS